MSAPTALRRVAAGLQLPLLPEPVELRPALRALAEEAPRQGADLLIHPDEVAAFIWERWGDDLERGGFDRHAFLAVLAEYQRELWYWVWGNRTWAQCTQGLAGRLARRASHGDCETDPNGRHRSQRP